MTKKYCDKCGKEVNRYVGMNTLFPMYKIMYVQSINLKCDIDLCGECSNDLEKWLKGEGNNNGNKMINIPKDATNGDVIKAMFPNESDDFETDFDPEWWNEHYGGNENADSD